MKEEIPVGEYLVPIGKAKVVHEGKHLTLVAHSRMVTICKEVVIEYAKKGISIELIDLRTIKPLDITTVLQSIKKQIMCDCRRGTHFAGIAAEIGFEINEYGFDYLDAPIGRSVQRETPMPYSKVLEAETLPNKQRIMEQINKTLR